MDTVEHKGQENIVRQHQENGAVNVPTGTITARNTPRNKDQGAGGVHCIHVLRGTSTPTRQNGAVDESTGSSPARNKQEPGSCPDKADRPHAAGKEPLGFDPVRQDCLESWHSRNKDAWTRT
jgi:hypothetical protein